MANDSDKEVTKLFAILHKWGVHSLGQLAALNREQLGARLGPLATRLWDLAAGKSQRLLRLVRPPEIFREEIACDYEMETAEPLLFFFRRFLEQLAQRLGALYLVARELRLELIFADKSSYSHLFQIPEPTASVDILFRLLQMHLENFRAENPVTGLALEVQPAISRRQQFDLFEMPLRDPARLQETLNRLTALLGAERVGTPLREDSHRPEAFHLVPFVWKLTELPNELLPNEQARPLAPALRQFREEIKSVSESEIIARQGPYLASGNWWDEKKWQRAEWDLQLASGELCRAQAHERSAQIEALYD